MTLASSGSINLAGASTNPQRSILAELAPEGATAPISLISTNTRYLTDILLGPITMPADFYGKSGLSYSVIIPALSQSYTEGISFTLLANTRGVPNGTTLYWTIVNGSTSNADFIIPFGSTTMTGTIWNAYGDINITAISDSITETGGETFGVQLRTGSTSGPVVATSGAITILDPTSTSGYVYYFGGTGYTSFSGAYFYTVPDGMTSIDLLMIGGGGGGGSAIYTGSGSSVAGAGGGGGGQVRSITGYSVTPGENLTINVGAGGSTGGSGGITSITGNTGATYIEAQGGSGGSSTVSSGGVGGNGGNSWSTNNSTIYNGGSTAYLSGSGGAGTGGPGAPGGENAPGQGGEGGPGVTRTLGPLTVDLGGGGGGGNYSTPTPGGPGGFGGGGAGSGASSNNPVAGTNYTGGGGGGARGRSSGVSSNEIGALGGYGRLYFLSSIQPTVSLGAVDLQSSLASNGGGNVQTWNELVFETDGRMTTEEGTNSAPGIAYNVSGSWLTSSPAGTSTSTAMLYDIELTPSAHALAIDGIRYSSGFGGNSRETWSTGTAWNTRIQLGTQTVGRFLSAESIGNGNTYQVTEYLNFTATIYLHGTNSVVASAPMSFYVDSTDGVLM